MNRFIKSLPKHFFTACISLHRHMAMTISSISAILVTMLLMGILLLAGGNIDAFTKNVENEVKIHVSIDSLTKDDEIKTLEKEISSIPQVKHVAFSSSEDELNTLIEHNGAVFSRYKDRNPMPNVFEVEVYKAEDVQTVAKKIASLNGIEKADYGGSSIENLIAVFEVIRNTGVAVIAVLGVLTIFLITHTIRMSIYTRKIEISIMRNVGAENWYICMPFVFEGMMIGFVGAIIPAVISIFAYSSIFEMLNGYFVSDMFVLKPVAFSYGIAGVLVLAGILVGMFGSFLATRKYLRWRR